MLLGCRTRHLSKEREAGRKSGRVGDAKRRAGRFRERHKQHSRGAFEGAPHPSFERRAQLFDQLGPIRPRAENARPQAPGSATRELRTAAALISGRSRHAGRV